MIILLAPEKIITSTSIDQWAELKQYDIVLFTSQSDRYSDYLARFNVFKQIEYFENYALNDLVEFKLYEYADKFKISNIISMTETDILRAAVVREKLKLEGSLPGSVIQFRDKIIMKEIARTSGINTPRFKRIKYTTDLLDFIDEVGYPIIIKPILGRGSFNTFSILNQSDLKKHLKNGFISNTSRYTDLLAEEYIDANIYHIDGLQLEYKIQTISVSRYINNCLSFVNGSYLGSYTLAFNNALRNELINFSTKLLGQAFQLPKNSLFHIEVFVENNGKISLCEIAARIGGNGINDEVRLQQGIDIKMEYIKAECRSQFESPEYNKSVHPVAGRLLIPPKEGQLLSIPDFCNMEGVIRYENRGFPQKKYKKMSMSNDEIANFLLVSSGEEEINEKIKLLVSWFDQKVIWQT